MLSVGSISYSIKDNKNDNLEDFNEIDLNELNNIINKDDSNNDNNNDNIDIKINKYNKNKNREVNKNNIYDVETKDKILVKYEEKNNDPTFIFYDNKNLLLGQISISHIIKYLSSPYIKNKESFELIKKLIFEININKNTSNVEILIKPYNETPFTGNLEMLLKLSNGMKEYEKKLESELLKIDKINIRKKINIIINQFNFCLLNHMLKVIHSISEQIKNDTDNKDLKDKLLKYSLGINYRIGIYIKNQLTNQIEQNKQIGENMINLLDVKKKIINKLNNLENNIIKQNKKIDEILKKQETNLINSTSTTITNTSTTNNTSKSILSSMDDKFNEKFKLNNLNKLFEDNDNKFESDKETNSVEYIDSIETSKNDNLSETLSHVSGIYKVNYEN